MLRFLREFSKILLNPHTQMENSELMLANVIEILGYVRIGTNYYKLVERPNTDGSTERKLITWTVECIKADHGKDFVAKIPKLDGFCLFPNHFNFQKVVGNFYNLYHEFNHKSMSGDWKITQNFIQHIFGKYYQLGLDYLKFNRKNIQSICFTFILFINLC